MLLVCDTLLICFISIYHHVTFLSIFNLFYMSVFIFQHRGFVWCFNFPWMTCILKISHTFGLLSSPHFFCSFWSFLVLVLTSPFGASIWTSADRLHVQYWVPCGLSFRQGLQASSTFFFKTFLIDSLFWAVFYFSLLLISVRVASIQTFFSSFFFSVIVWLDLFSDIYSFYFFDSSYFVSI